MSETTIKQFFSDLYHDCTDGCITLMTLPDQHCYHVPVMEADKAAALAEKLGEKVNTYYCTALRKAGLNAYTRGDEKEICTVVCMYADIDVKGEAHKQKALPETQEEAEAFVNGLDLKPSYLISSGNGIHAIWLLEEPFQIASGEDLDEIKALSAGFGAYVLREGQKNGWVLDNVQDIPRMLRCPGTMNFKTDPPKKCQILKWSTDDDGQIIRYPLSDFERYKGEETASESVDITNVDIGPAERMQGHCAFVDYCIKNADSLSEPWWHAFLSIVALTEDGFTKGHEWSESYAGYDESETEERLKRALKANRPCSCRYIRNNVGFNCPEGGCENCGHIVGSPIVFSYYTKDEQVERLLKEETLTLDEAVTEKNLLLASYAKEHNPSAYLRLKNKYRKLGVSARDLEKSIRSVAENNLKTSAKEDFFGELNLNGIDTKGMNLPEGWDLSMDGISHVEMGMNGPFIKKITASPVLITKKFNCIDADNKKLELSFYWDNHWKHITVPRGDVMDKGKLVKYSDYGLPVSSGNAALLVSFLSEFEAINMNNLPSARSIDHMGWIGGMAEFYPFHMNGETTFEAEASEASKLVKAIHTEGDEEKWKDMAVKLRTMPFARTMLAASFASVLLEPLQIRNIYLHIWNDSRSGKSAAAKAAASIWGDPNALMMNYNSTMVGFERSAAAMNHMPLVIDELQESRMKPEQFSQLVYMLGNGSGRTRGDKYGGTQDLLHWHNCILSTGEQPILTNNSMDGEQTRVMDLYGKPISDEAFAREVHQVSERNYGFAGEKFVQWLFKNYFTKERNSTDPAGHGAISVDKLKSDYEKLGAYINEVYSLLYDDPGFPLQNVSAIMLGDALSSQSIFGVDKETAMNDAMSLGLTILSNIHSQEKKDSISRAWDFICDWARSNKEHFVVKKVGNKGFTHYGLSPIYGRYFPEEEEIHFIPSCLYSALESGGFNLDKCYTGFKERGLIDSKQKLTRVDEAPSKTIIAGIPLDLKDPGEIEDEEFLA